MRTKPPKISVVIPLYNKEHQVARAIESVLKQSFQDFEVIVIDDGSSDRGADIVAAYTDPRVRLYRQVNHGVSAARNFGVSIALCELISFLDADDAYSHDFLQNIWRMHHDHPTATAYAMNYEVVTPSGSGGGRGVTVVRGSEIILEPYNFFEIARYGSPVSSSSVAVQKTILQKIGGFPVGVKLGEDLDTWIRLLFSGFIVFNSRVGAYYYADDSMRAMQVNSPPDHYVFFDTCDDWVRNHLEYSQVAKDIEEFKNFFRLTYAHFQIKRGDRTLGRMALKKCSTTVFLSEKKRLLIMSFLPQFVYRALSEIKTLTRHATARLSTARKNY